MRVVSFPTFIRLVFFGFFISTGAALAGNETKCDVQYSFEERSILEWAAIGGDPHAQYAISQCAYPDGHGALSTAEKIYAIKWLTLATCEASDSQSAVARDRMTRKLKDEGDLSFRRFGGVTGDEKWTRREIRFREYREEQNAKLKARYDALMAETGEDERLEARDALADQLARIGPLGLIRLGELTACKNFGAGKSFAAAAWSAADDVLRASNGETAYGADDREIAAISKESAKHLASLSEEERRAVTLEKARLLKTSPQAISKLENWAALGKLENLADIHSDIEATSFGQRSVTSAAQYALEALGWLSFVNGPDNDYGPSTIEAAQKAQVRYGHQPTRWLSHEEIRRLVCDAALQKDDPVSYYHLGVMYSEGWGFPQDVARAREAIGRAQSIMQARLADEDALPEWKRKTYPAIMTQIESAKTSIDSAYAGLPADLRSERTKTAAAVSLCQ